MRRAVDQVGPCAQSDEDIDGEKEARGDQRTSACDSGENRNLDRDSEDWPQICKDLDLACRNLDVLRSYSWSAFVGVRSPLLMSRMIFGFSLVRGFP